MVNYGRGLTVMHFLGGECFFLGVLNASAAASAAARLEAEREALKHTTTSTHYSKLYKISTS